MSIEQSKTPITKEQLESEYAKHNWQPLKDFISCIRDGDELCLEKYNNRKSPLSGFGYSQYVGTRKDSITYILRISTWMS